jgi:hypothetical protein
MRHTICIALCEPIQEKYTQFVTHEEKYCIQECDTV